MRNTMKLLAILGIVLITYSIALPSVRMVDDPRITTIKYKLKDTETGAVSFKTMRSDDKFEDYQIGDLFREPDTAHSYPNGIVRFRITYVVIEKKTIK